MNSKVINVILICIIGGYVVYTNRPKKVKYEFTAQYWKDGKVVFEEKLTRARES